MSFSDSRKKLTLAFKGAVTIGLIGILLYIVDWDQAAELVNHGLAKIIIVVPALLLVGLAVAAWRWRIILTNVGVSILYRQTYLGYLLGSFYNVFLPGVIGGDMVRVAYCKIWTQCGLGIATTSVLLERVFGVLALMIIACLTYMCFPRTLSALLAVEGTSIVLVLAGGGMLLVVITLIGRQIWIGWLLQKDKIASNPFVPSVLRTLNALDLRILGTIVVLSALYQMVWIFTTFYISRAIGLFVPIHVFFSILPLVYLVTVLPVSLGGVGVREGAFVLLLAQFGVMASDAVTLSFLEYLSRIAIAGLSGVMHLFVGLPGKKTLLRIAR